jgi:uncharacterized protein
MVDRRNRLTSAASPYLLQHASNPVDWFPWGSEAFERARTESRPIFLSVGYAACHWCHVMERESFEDERTAKFLNEHFISVKVDREERPDVDALYMRAVQAMSGGHGGWPMSVFLTSDGKPFFAGTYFPAEPTDGMPSFIQVLEGVATAWRDQAERVGDQSGRLMEVLERRLDLADTSIHETGDLPDLALAALRSEFDPLWGGTHGAPKFPQAPILSLLFRLAVSGRDDAERMLVTTLDRMADGGIYDHVDGGFARYSTDVRWHVPHFEKMLYDNAQLAQVYLRAWTLTRDGRHSAVVRDVCDWMISAMRDPAGGFWSSIDADSDGVEGKYYTWTWDELVNHVGEPVARAFGATPGGNWQGSGLNVLWHPEPIDKVALSLSIDPAELRALLQAGRETLSLARSQRTPPAVDDKVLASWNGMAVRALAEAGRTLDDARYVDAARTAGRFAWEHLRRTSDGRLLRSWRRGRASHVPAFSDDYAFLALGYLALYETTSEVSWFEYAVALVESLLSLFRDDAGGFFQAGSDTEPLVVRHKDIEDQAIPSGNSAAAEALIRLSMYVDNQRYEEAARGAVARIAHPARRVPMAFPHAISVISLLSRTRREIVVVGGEADPRTGALRHVIFSSASTFDDVVACSTPAGVDTDGRVVPLLAGKTAIRGDPTAYVCERFACLEPVRDPASLSAQLRAR